MIFRKTGICAALALLPFAAACSRSGDIDPSGGIVVVRTACPVVGVPAGTGDITLFDPAGNQTASAIDVSATITNVRANCSETGAEVVSTVTFDVLARRSDASAARDVALPYYVTIVRGGSNVVAKRVAQANVHFDAGQVRAQVAAQGTAVINRSAATLPENIRNEITRERKPGDPDAALDPLTNPEVRAAVAAATFEAMVGFQLTEDQLKYNLTR